MTRLAPLLALCAMSACAATTEPDYGGDLVARMAYVDSTAITPIPSVCASACTLHVAKGCITPNTRMGFHGPLANSGIGLLPSVWEQYSRIMADYYPPALAEWFIAEARYSRDLIWLDYEQLLAMGVEGC